MDFIYVLIGDEWEEMVIFLSKEEAIIESIKHPNNRIEIFSKNDKSGYIPTYNYYENGNYIHNSYEPRLL
jgi:hypothetical protein